MAKKGVIVPRRDGLVGEWLLNGNALDTASTNNGTATNVTYINTDRGYQKQCGVFNGSSSSITASLTQTWSSGYTVCGWVNNTTIGTGSAERYIFRLHNSGTSILYFMTYQDKWYVYHSGGAVVLHPTSAVPIASKNQFYTIWFSGNTVKLYIDSVEVATSSSASGLGSFNTVDIGYRSGVGYLSGNTQSVRLFNRALGIDEIQNWYLEGLRKLGGGSMSGLFDGLVAYYDMRGDANDIVGGNNGTVTGATLTTDRFGFANGAYSFVKASSNRIELTNQNLSFTNPFSFSFITRNTGSSGTLRIILNEQNATQQFTIGVHTNNQLFTYDGTTAVYSGVTFADGKYMVTRNGTSFIIYKDGVQLYTASHTFLNNSQSSKRFIGCQYYSAAPQDFYQGTFDEFIFWNTTKTAVEAKALYDLQSLDKLLPFN